MPLWSPYSCVTVFGMSIAVTQKKRGRPPTGQDPHLTVRVPAELLARVEGFAESQALARSEAIRQLIEAGLAARESE